MHEFPLADEEPPADISLSSFAAFVGTPERGKRLFVAKLQEEYSPARDYYGQIREAIKAGRRINNDRLAMDGVLASCPPGRKHNYGELAGGWLHFVASCSNDTLIDIPAGRWRTSGIRVRVTPDLAVRRADGSYEAIKLYFRNDKPSEREVATTLWLLRRTLPRILREARPALLDVRRAKLYDRMPLIDGFEQLLEAEAVRLAALRAELAA